MSESKHIFGYLKEKAKESNCLRNQVAAAIIIEEDAKLWIATNRTPKGVEGCNECFRIKNNVKSGTRYETCRSIHAEQLVILQMTTYECEGRTLYVYGHSFVCDMCKRFIIEAGIKDVYLRESMDHKVQYFTREDLMKGL